LRQLFNHKCGCNKSLIIAKHFPSFSLGPIDPFLLPPSAAYRKTANRAYGIKMHGSVVGSAACGHACNCQLHKESVRLYGTVRDDDSSGFWRCLRAAQRLSSGRIKSNTKEIEEGTALHRLPKTEPRIGNCPHLSLLPAPQFLFLYTHACVWLGHAGLHAAA
jgi:hypothetical protein